MKYTFKIFCTWLLGGLVLLSTHSCIEKFEEINTNNTDISDDELKTDFQHVGAPIVQAQQNIYSYGPAWLTQLQQNFIGDVYSGYMMSPTPFASNSNNMTYNLVDGWNGFPWNTAYTNVMGPLRKSDAMGGNGFNEFKAWAKILRVEAMHRVSDIYGPIVYTKFGQDIALYDTQEEAYNAFFDDLSSAIKTLTPIVDQEIKTFKAFDLVYEGDYKKWVQFANSLRLRLAIRVSKVNPVLAEIQGETALAHPLGLITSNDANFIVSSASGENHPLNIINSDWNDIRMGAPMESILIGYEDSRISSYFEQSEDFPGQYKGIRQGIEISSKSKYVGFSKLAKFDKIQLMTAAEVHFLKAEAALRGWTGAGDPQANYEAGILTSFDQHGADDFSEYITDDTKVPTAYIDPLNTDNSVTGSELSAVTIKWDNTADFETKLERIITQKWIAMYPDGQEAWSEFRRTGYPKLFPVKINLSGGKVDSDEFIKRINFPTNEITTNPVGYESGISALGGPDHGGTSLWWDID